MPGARAFVHPSFLIFVVIDTIFLSCVSPYKFQLLDGSTFVKAKYNPSNGP